MMTAQQKFTLASLEAIHGKNARSLGVFELLAFVHAYWQLSYSATPDDFIDGFTPDEDTRKAFLAMVQIGRQYEIPC